MRQLKIQANDPQRAGQLASRKAMFNGSRFACAAVHTRFEAVQFFVWDAEQTDEVTGGPAVIRQDDNPANAVAGLPEGELALRALEVSR
jgi:hypothetical protein